MTEGPRASAGGHVQAEGRGGALGRLAFLPLDLPALPAARVRAAGVAWGRSAGPALSTPCPQSPSTAPLLVGAVVLNIFLLSLTLGGFPPGSGRQSGLRADPALVAGGPSWRCPGVCPTPSPLRPKEASQESAGPRSKRALEEEEGGADTLSKNKQKKQLRNPHKTFDPSLKRELLQLLPEAVGEA